MTRRINGREDHRSLSNSEGCAFHVNHHYGMYERHPLISFYHRSVLRYAVRLARVSAGMSVLDYGCGRQMLQQMLPPHVNYTGYDADDELCCGKDPWGRQYDVVFAVQVLQLIEKTELESLVAHFAGITSRVVVMVPSRNAFKRYVLDVLFGLKKAADATFLSEPEGVYRAMQSAFARERVSKFPLLAEFSVWTRREPTTP